MIHFDNRLYDTHSKHLAKRLYTAFDLDQIASFPDSNPTYSVIHVTSLGRDAPIHLRERAIHLTATSHSRFKFQLKIHNTWLLQADMEVVLKTL